MSNYESVDEGPAMDEILQYCVDHPKERITINRIINELFPSEDPDVIKIILSRIDSTHDQVAVVSLTPTGEFIQANGLTKIFLEQGGFTARNNKENQERTLIIEKEKTELALAKANLLAAETNDINERFNKVATIINVIIGLINIAVIIWQTQQD